MAFIKSPKTDDEIKRTQLTQLRKEYSSIAETYMKMINGEYIVCLDCGEWQSRTKYYSSKKFNLGYYPVCKSCIMKKIDRIASNSSEKNKALAAKEPVMEVCHDMDVPYIDSFYDECCKAAEENYIEGNDRIIPFSRYISSIQTFANFRSLRWKDSEFPLHADSTLSNEVKRDTIRRFGEGYNNEEYLFLQDDYDDWITRYECQTKAQEEIFTTLSMLKLSKRRALREGKSTKDIDATILNYMNSAGITPRQSAGEQFVQANPYGVLLDKWENTRPLPEIDESLKDKDGLVKYITVFFLGHATKLFGLANKYLKLYEDYMKPYTAKPPQYDEDDDDIDVEDEFEKMFGRVDT